MLSLVREPRLTCWSHLDERCAGFFALGAAKASGVPVAVTCTSGTAAANLAPAVIEAFHARVPLLVLTADRPPELREVGAGQTIDQLALYGGAAKWFFEVGTHEATPERLRWMRTLACRAYWIALTGRPGPVHLNFPLREPLVLDRPLAEDRTARGGDEPFVMVRSPPREPVRGPTPPSGRIVIVAGAGAGERVAEIAARSSVPLLADPLSGARRGPAAIVHYDLLLRDPRFAAAHRPQFILRAGDLPTSKPLRAWLAGLDGVAQIAFDPHAAWQDPDAVVGMRVTGELPDAEVSVEDGWLESWRAADALAGETVGAVLGADLSEPLVAAALAEWLPARAALYVASSMPVRDLEEFFPGGRRVLANRGANGIDGTVSSAFGAAAAGEGPLVLLIGDVALLHDIGGLLSAKRLGLALTIVLLNNDGGGIFHFLPVAGERDAFEEHVATPHGIEFARVAALYGCDYELPGTAGALREAIDRSIQSGGVTIIEVRTDRRENLALHRRVAEAVLSAFNPPAPGATPPA